MGLLLGAGATPLGVGPYGIGTPATAPVPGSVPLQGRNGVVYGSREIGTTTANRGQYVIDDTYGRIRGMSDVSQMVYLAYRTERGTAADQDLGQRFTSIETIGDDFEEQLRAECEAPVAKLIAAGLVRFDGVEIAVKDGSRVGVVVRLTDLTTQNPITVNL